MQQGDEFEVELLVACVLVCYIGLERFETLLARTFSLIHSPAGTQSDRGFITTNTSVELSDMSSPSSNDYHKKKRHPSRA